MSLPHRARLRSVCLPPLPPFTIAFLFCLAVPLLFLFSFPPPLSSGSPWRLAGGPRRPRRSRRFTGFCAAGLCRAGPTVEHSDQGYQLLLRPGQASKMTIKRRRETRRAEKERKGERIEKKERKDGPSSENKRIKKKKKAST